MRTIGWGLLVFALFLGISCSEDESGRIVMRMVDSPADVESVTIDIARIEVHEAGGDTESGWIEVNATPGMYDLLELRNGITAVITDFVLPPGHYTQIRMYLGPGSTIVLDGMSYPLEIPSDIQSGLKLNHQFTIEPDAVYDLTLDFDAERSIVETGMGQYQLKPVIRLQATEAAGSISGVISLPDGGATIRTIVGADTVSTTTDLQNGSFKLMALPGGTFAITVVPGDLQFQEATLESVVVVPGQDTSVGTIVFSGP